MAPGLLEILDWVEAQQNEVLDMFTAESKFNDLEVKSRKLNGWMRHKLRGVSRLWCKDKDPVRGIQNWRDMLAKYDPTTGASLLDLQSNICQVKRALTIGDISNFIDKWESDYRTYLKKVGQELGDLMKQNMLLVMLPQTKWEILQIPYAHTKGNHDI